MSDTTDTSWTCPYDQPECSDTKCSSVACFILAPNEVTSDA